MMKVKMMHNKLLRSALLAILATGIAIAGGYAART